MAVDYAEKEREFLESLAADTGRDLSGWMTAISATSLTDRNAIIDWLRQQGFLFARASWLERIHHNGGRPIYLDPAAFDTAIPPRDKPQLVSPMLPVKPAAAVPTPQVLPTPRPPLAPLPVDPVATVRQPRSAPSETASLDALLAEAKAYRPLAQFLLREIEKARARLGVRGAERVHRDQRAIRSCGRADDCAQGVASGTRLAGRRGTGPVR